MKAKVSGSDDKSVFNIYIEESKFLERSLKTANPFVKVVMNPSINQ
jgi:hypothetical protein